MTLKNLNQDAKKIIYDLAVEYGHGHYSTLEPFDIDYKFWEDIGIEELVCNLASKLANAQQTIYDIAIEGTR